MRHVLILAPTGIVMGLLKALVGLPIQVEMAAWLGLYILWVVYGVRANIAQPVRRVAFCGTLAGLLAGSTQVILMEQYKANNPWYADVFETSSAQNLSTSLLGQNIALGIVFGLITGLLIRWRLGREAG